jgi:predicted transposase YbfD/YdcC
VLQSPIPLTAISFKEFDLLPNILELEDPRTYWTQHQLTDIVTIDAIGAQEKIAQQIINQEGNYVISLKGNQETFHKNVVKAFEEAVAKEWEGVRQLKQGMVA